MQLPAGMCFHPQVHPKWTKMRLFLQNTLNPRIGVELARDLAYFFLGVFMFEK